MTDGLPLTEFTSFDDAVQWVACGTARSLRPNWLHEEEDALSSLIVKCAREMSAAADEGRPYPFDSVDIVWGNPAEVVTTLHTHRGNWPPSGQALYDAAIAAAAARVDKDERRQGAHRRVIEGWRHGELHVYGLDADTGRFERINPVVADSFSEDEPGEIEIRDGAMFKNPAGAPGYSRHPIYRNLVIRRRTLIDWAGRSGTGANANAEAVPSGEKMESPAREEGPSRQPKADPANAEAPIEADAGGRGSTDAPESAATPIRTGLPGRPTSIHVILAEAERRLAAGDVPETAAAFAKELLEWFAGIQERRRPEDRAPVPTVRTLETPLRPLLRKYGRGAARKITP